MFLQVLLSNLTEQQKGIRVTEMCLLIFLNSSRGCVFCSFNFKYKIIKKRLQKFSFSLHTGYTYILH